MAKKISEIHLVLFLSRATPLSRWKTMGILDRELAIYKSLAENLGKLSIISSGGKNEINLIPENGNMSVCYNRWNISPNMYSIMAPFLYRKELSDATIYKTNQIDGAWTAILAGFLFKKPTIVRAGYLWSELMKPEKISGSKKFLIETLQKFSLYYANTLVVTSPSIKEYVSKKYNINPNMIFLIPNSVDTDFFLSKPEIEVTKGRITYIGRLHPIKNLKSLIIACSGIADTNLVLIGDGPQRKELENLSNKYHANVTFRGTIPNNQIPQELNQTEVFILPSFLEGHPKALIEAMACEKPVIGTNVAGIQEIIRDHETGLLCETDKNSIQNAIINLLDNSSLKQQLGKNARKFVLDNYSFKRIKSLELDMIISVLNQ